ncbi:uncharacterized protein LOC114167105 [Vigna unguiculata]|uniref:Acyl-coenzyme A thioesterase 13 n=1 Tax=Vigna unguiculata TaxID=3917 RepID=A0A4D6MQ46_VIGUN|nr:uncharacterized protein LOC114167105 [Vigna unguiculata]QCE02037.1 hypothetical protein DEO72_LG8g48 [Vigna unguiculata]
MIEKEKKNRCFEDVQKWIKGLSDGTYGNQIETSTTKGLRLVKAHKGFLLCDMIIHTGLLDESGNWHVSAIATLVDMVGSVAPYTLNQCHHVTLDLNISYFSMAKVQEEVEIEAKVVGKKDDLTSVIVEVRKKKNAELVALGKLWMAVSTKNAKHQASKL